MGTRFTRSAFKHGITREQIEHVIQHCGLVFDEAAPPGTEHQWDRLMYLGDDLRGVPLEVLAVTPEDGAILVIHAMKLRRKLLPGYRMALTWRIP